jgi:type II secretory pathway pseudopilin PulG
MLIHSKKGMTLVEVIVSAGILALVIVSLVAAIANISVFSRQIDAAYTATNLAKDRMDSLKTFGFRDLPRRAPETDHLIDIDGDGVIDFKRTTEVQENFNGNPYLIRVKVGVDRIRLIDEEPLGKPVVIEALFADVGK